MDRDQVARNALASMAADDERERQRRAATVDAERRWYLVQMSAKAAPLAIDYLGRHQLAVYRPLVRTMTLPPLRSLAPSQRKNRHLMIREKIEAFFPGYAFVRFDARRDPWHGLFGVVGVYGIACAENQPHMIGDQLIEALQAREVNGAIPGETLIEHLPFKVGDDVRFKEGALSGFTGRVDQVDANGRIKLILPAFGTVSANFDELEQHKPRRSRGDHGPITG